MIKFKKLSIKNFLSYGESPTVIDLDKTSTTLIVGEDLDNTASGLGANGVGKSQPLHCNIKTPTGWTPMGYISVGDIVSTPDGNDAKVIGVFPQGKIDTYRIHFVDGRTTEACGEHLWKVNSHRWQKNKKSNAEKIISTKKLKKYVDESILKNKAWYNCTIPTIVHPEKDDIDLPIPPYLLGALLGDGTIGHRNIRFTSMDDSIINNVSNLLREAFAQELSYEKNYNYYVRNVIKKVGRSPIADMLNNLGLLGTTSDNKFIPDQYLENTSKDQKIQLLQGLLDTDGNVGKNGAVTYCSISEQLIKDVQYLIRSIGGKAKISSRIPTYTNSLNEKTNGKLVYNLLIQYKTPKNLFSLERKKDKISDDYQYDNTGLRVIKVEKIHKQVSQCIMIDHPEHLYITDNFVVTHNTVWVNALIYALYGKPISNISLDNLVNNINKKNMEVMVEFEKDEKTYIIKRARKETGIGAYTRVYIKPINAKLNPQTHDKTPDSTNNINSFIVEHLGIPFELFVRIVAFAATHTPFLDLPVRHTSRPNQSDIMEELFRLTRLSFKADNLREKIKYSKQSLETKLKHNEQLEKELERYNKQLDSAKERVSDWDDDHADNIKSNNKKLAQYKKIDIKGQEKFHEELADLTKELELVTQTEEKIENSANESGILLKEKTTELQRILKQKKSAEERVDEYETEHVENLKEIQDEIFSLEKIDTDEQSQLNITLVEKEKELTELVDIQSSAEDIIANQNTIVDDAARELIHLEKAKCPYCLQDFENTEKKVEKCQNTIKEADNLIEKETKIIKNCSSKLKSIKKEYDSIKKKITHSPDDLQDILRSLIRANEKLEEATHSENPYKVQLDEIDENDISARENKISELKKDINKMTAELKKAYVNVDNVTKSKDVISAKITIDTVAEIYEIKNEISRYNEKAKELKKEINPYNEPLKELEEIELEPIDMEAVNKLNKLLEHQNYLLKLLTKKDSFIRKKLLNKNLTFLNQRLKYYLDAIGLPHKVEFTQEMTANITQFGRELDFGNLSSGQKARVNLALSFAFRDVLQQSHDTINVCMLDEVLDVGLDSVGVQNAAKMLKRKATDENLTLFIISHRDEVSNIFDNRMIVRMEKSFSSVRLE